MNTAIYGLVNANAKWQIQSDEPIKSFGLVQIAVMPQLFHLVRDKKLVLTVANIVDEILATGKDAVVDKFISDFNAKCNVGTIKNGPGMLCFFSLNIIQNEDCSSSIDCNDKLETLEVNPISRTRRKEQEDSLNDIELSNYKSVISSIGWLGITA